MQRILATLGTTAAVVGFAYQADGATLGATGGRAWKDDQTHCFINAGHSSAVVNDCDATASYLVPLQIPSNTTTDYRFYATSTAGPNTSIGVPPTCRVLVINRYSTDYEISDTTSVWDNTTLDSSMPVSSTQTVQIDCRLPGTDQDFRHGLASVRFVAL